MNMRIIGLFCSLLIMSGLFTACGKAETDQQQPAGAYWKTAGFDGTEITSGDYWSDLFLWDDGTGYFRVSQATPASNYYGMSDEKSCDWSLEANGSLTLFSPGTKTVLYSGSVANDVLTLPYDGYAAETIKMEPAEMPPYGSHWSIPNLYGTWKMLAYTDTASGYHAVPYYTAGSTQEYFASEITLDQVIGVHFWLADPLNDRLEIIHDLDIGKRDNDDTWHPLTAGAIWEDCVNQAWYAELTGNNNPDVQFYVTYADDKLLLKKKDKTNPNNFPASFTAEFEYVGYREYLGEGDGKEIVNQRYAEVAYSMILDQYRKNLQNDLDFSEKADFLVSALENYAHIGNEVEVNELRTSIVEPLSGNSNLGYATHDLNHDGIPELIILSEEGYLDDYAINSIFTLHNGRTALVGAYWSRNRCVLDQDGTLYINGSSGADDNFSASFSLSARTGKLQLIERFSMPYEPSITTQEAGLVFKSLVNNNQNPTNDIAKQGNAEVNLAQIYPFSSIVEYNGKVYSIYASPEIPNFIGITGSTKFTSLPQAITQKMESQDMYVYRFTIYQDKIYYLAAEPGSDVTPGVIGRCNLDGSQPEELAEVNNFSTCMIADSWLYSDGNAYASKHEIFGIDLNNMRFVPDLDFPDMIEPGIVDYNGFYYYFSGSTLYKKEMKTESISEIITLTTGPMNTTGEGSVLSAAGGTVYYVTLGEYSESGNAYLFGVSINGGASEFLASWFKA